MSTVSSTTGVAGVVDGDVEPLAGESLAGESLDRGVIGGGVASFSVEFSIHSPEEASVSQAAQKVQSECPGKGAVG